MSRKFLLFATIVAFLCVEGTFAANVGDPLCFKAKSDLSEVLIDSVGAPTAVVLQYKLNEDEWQDYTLRTVIQLNDGDSVKFRNKSEDATGFSKGEGAYYFFKNKGDFSVGGDITTLLSSKGGVKLIKDFSFLKLFADDYHISDASDLILPSAIVNKSCYSQMFYNCTSLETVPDSLPAKLLAAQCYYRMFFNCEKLQKAPKISATSLGEGSCEEMFAYCAYIDSVEVAFSAWEPKTATTNWLFEVAQKGTFICPSALPKTRGVSNIPELWAVSCPDVAPVNPLCFTATQAGTNIGLYLENKAAQAPAAIDLVYSRDSLTWKRYEIGTALTMENVGDKVYFCNIETTATTFSTGLKTYYYFASTSGEYTVSGDLSTLLCQGGNAESVADYGFYNLFAKNTTLTDASNLVLPSTKMGIASFREMFKGCENLKFAPALSSTTLADSCYYNMFTDCANLTYISVMFENWDNLTATENWVSGVAEGGVFMAPAALPKTRGVNNIPAKWLVPYTDVKVTNPVCFTANADGSEVILSSVGAPKAVNFAYSIDGANWWDFPLDTPYILNEGEKIYFCNTSPTETATATSQTDYYHFNATKGDISVSGDATTLLCQAGKVSILPKSAFIKLFSGCKNLTDASQLYISSTEVGEMSCYAMFDSCQALVKAPVLPATTLAISCYGYMFNECTSLTDAPVLAVETLAENCYEYMFKGSGIVQAPNLPADIAMPQCYMGMFSHCEKLVKAPVLGAVMLDESCFAKMFEYCTSLETAPVINSSTLPDRSCYLMFRGCSALKNIEVKFTFWNEEDAATTQWMEGVAENGTFICPDGLSLTLRDSSHFPASWQRQTPVSADETTEDGKSDKVVKILTPRGWFLVYPDGQIKTFLGQDAAASF